MDTNSNIKRIDFLKQDGSDLFLEGDIAGATELYVAAMRLELDQHIQKLITSKQTSQGNDDTSTSDEKNTETCKKCSGMNSIIAAVIQDAEEAIKINPTLSKPYKSKATALILQTKWDEAREVYLTGIKACDDCTELRQALKKLQKTQTILQSFPEVLERTRSLSSSDTSESTLDGTSKAKRFRLQHRKKLSMRPNTSGLVMTTTGSLHIQEDDNDKITTTNTTS